MSESNWRDAVLEHESTAEPEIDLEFARAYQPKRQYEPSTNPFQSLIELIGEDPSREGLVKTPTRALDAFHFMTSGYKASLTEVVNGALFQAASHDMIIVRNIEFYSLCEHHLMPFFGRVNVAYIPDQTIIGLSKIPKIVDVFARRLQIQENLGNQIAQALQDLLKPKGVAVSLSANHTCMSMRGVQKQHADMIVSCMLGSFRSDSELRKEFFSLCK